MPVGAGIIGGRGRGAPKAPGGGTDGRGGNAKLPG
jgi:hypothetical protein